MSDKIGERLGEMGESRTIEEISAWWAAIDKAARNAPDFPQIRYSHAKVKELMEMVKQRELAIQGLSDALIGVIPSRRKPTKCWCANDWPSNKRGHNEQCDKARAALDAARKGGFIR